MSNIASKNNLAIIFDQVSVSLDGVSILDSVTASVPMGSSTAIVGPNGAGKTTLIHALIKQIKFTGSIHLRSSTGSENPHIGYVPQRLSFDRNMPLTVLEFMLMGIQRMPLWFGAKAKYSKVAKDMLAEVEADFLCSRKLGALSGGELQRVLLALALGQSPDILVLDEPAAGVDFKGEQVFCELLEKLRKELGFTQLMISHDLATVTHHASHVICLNHKVIAEGPPQKTFTHENLAAVFGIHMGLIDSRALPAKSSSCSAPCCSENLDV